ncbi:hypothetical protein [Microbulbifer taiwanensis]|uniref:hypothetical protein n=1 Tax=Microbulbifer taiwanensis TaxID=986746 RepID=UPI00361A0F2D
MRAGTLQLPDPVTVDWSDKFALSAGPGRLQQLQLLDLAGENRDPFTAHQVQLGAIEYSGKTRALEIGGIALESASGCVPGQLWQQPDYCARLAGLHSADPYCCALPRARSNSPGDLPADRCNSPSSACSAMARRRSSCRNCTGNSSTWWAPRVLRPRRYC